MNAKEMREELLKMHGPVSAYQIAFRNAVKAFKNKKGDAQTPNPNYGFWLDIRNQIFSQHKKLLTSKGYSGQ